MVTLEILVPFDDPQGLIFISSTCKRFLGESPIIETIRKTSESTSYKIKKLDDNLTLLIVDALTSKGYIIERFY